MCSVLAHVEQLIDTTYTSALKYGEPIYEHACHISARVYFSVLRFTFRDIL